MPNIILTSYCNLHCPYCFADTMINTENIKNISLAQFRKILYWAGKDSIEIGLIGGEPTLHPQFSEILDTLKEYATIIKRPIMYTLFTNGVYIDKYINDFPYNMGILINVNQPSAMTQEQYSRMLKNIEICDKNNWLTKNKEGELNKVNIGCNICQQIDDYDFFWNIVKKFNIKKIRVSVTAPTLKDQLKNKDIYYNSMKEKFLHFIDNAIKNDVILILDCNQIPYCYFTQEELKKINMVADIPLQKVCNCHPVIDITPEFKASSCFGAYKLINCADFPTLDALVRYIQYKVMYPKILGNCTGKCKTCKQYEQMECQGGCLAFSHANLD